MAESGITAEELPGMVRLRHSEAESNSEAGARIAVHCGSRERYCCWYPRALTALWGSSKTPSVEPCSVCSPAEGKDGIG